MSRDLQAAAKIQETFLPHELPRVPGAAFAWIYRPCDELGGDGLNVISLGDGKVGLYILDVGPRPWRRVGPSGHGTESCPVGAGLNYDPGRRRPGWARDHSPAEVADRLNQLFPYNETTEQFATIIYGVLDVRAGEFRYVSAGHPGPVLVPAGSPPVILEGPGFPIGLADDVFEERCVR